MSASKLRSRRATVQKMQEHDKSSLEKKEKTGRTRSVLKLFDSVDEDIKARSPKLKISEYAQNNGHDILSAKTYKLQDVNQVPCKSNHQNNEKNNEKNISQEDSCMKADNAIIIRGHIISEGDNLDCDGSIVNQTSRRRTRSSGVLNQSEQLPGKTFQSNTPKENERQSNLDVSTQNVHQILLDIVATPLLASKDPAELVQTSRSLTPIDKTVEAIHTYAKDTNNSKLEQPRLDEAARIPKRGRPPKHIKQLQQKTLSFDSDISNKSTLYIKSEPLSPRRTSPRQAKTLVKIADFKLSENLVTSASSTNYHPQNNVPINKPNNESLVTVVSTRSSPRKRSTLSRDSEYNEAGGLNTLVPLKKLCKSNVAKDLKRMFDNDISALNNTDLSVNEEKQNDEIKLANNSNLNIPEITTESEIAATFLREPLELTFISSRRSRRLSGKEPELKKTDANNQTQDNDQSKTLLSSTIKGTFELQSTGNKQCISLETKYNEDNERVFKEDEIGYEAFSWYREEPEESEPFYFESDHTALKGNKDYRMLLRTLATLEAQRQQAIKSLERLTECQRNALSDPVEFVENLQNKVDVDLPVVQRVVAIPNINWNKYINKLEGTELLKFATEVRSTRAKSSSASLPVENPSTSRDSITTFDVPMEKEEELVRGRLLEGNKSGTFNQLWTVEEQQRLEKCLVNYPQEEVEARRWEKVATALGNRTPQQVASRVQKYFIKLSKAGLPVPGRIPNMNMYMNKKTNRRMHHFTTPLLHQNSTFMQAYKPPVYMPDEDDDFQNINNSFEEERSLLNENISLELQDTEEYQELLRLTKIKNEMLERDQDEHLGFKCVKCGNEPITGIRWHCKDCPAQVSVDLCSICIDSKYMTDSHIMTHQMEPFEAENFNRHFEDKDYTSFSMGLWDYNYLDPNYNPVNL